MKKPKIPKRIPRPFKKAPAPEERVAEALQSVPKITNETLAEHREEVLSTARKYIYPLQHSKRRVVAVSSALLAAAIVALLAFCVLSLYRFQSTSGFIYDVTRVVPFPVAKAGKSWVSYESYLFELRRNLHYYESVQKVNFSDPANKPQLEQYKSQALERVVNDAYTKQIAAKNKVRVSSQDVNNVVNLLKKQNRLGTSDKMFATVLQEFWGWSEDDFRRELRQQILAQKVVAKLDTDTQARATQALNQITSGTDFGTLANQITDDIATKGKGGQYPDLIAVADRDVPPPVSDELFKLQPGQVSGVINTGYTLEIVKVLEKQGNKVRAAHIEFDLKDISTYIKPLKDKNKAHTYIKI
jgi:parvulin-like peptidyl-prolyl isomerase